MEENFENTKDVIRSGKWQNDWQYNGQEKQVNQNDRQYNGQEKQVNGQWLTKYYIETKNPTKKRGWTQVLRKGK